MRRILVVVAVLLLAWLAFMATPYIALLDLARAAESRDVEALKSRIDAAEVKRALAGQIAAVLRGRGRDGPLGESGAQAVRASIDPFLDPIVTPEALARLLAGRAEGGGAGARALPPDILSSLDRLGAYFAASEYRGFRAFFVSVPPERPATERFRITLRLRSARWRVVGIELPHALRDRLIESIRRGDIAGALATAP